MIEWVTLTEDMLLASLSGPELTAYKGAALQSGQGNPVPELLEQMCAEIAGYIAASDNPVDVPAGKVPKALSRAAISIVRFRIITRLPLNAQSLLETRQREYEDSVAMLRALARGDFSIGRVEATDSTGSARGACGSQQRLF